MRPGFSRALVARFDVGHDLAVRRVDDKAEARVGPSTLKLALERQGVQEKLASPLLVKHVVRAVGVVRVDDNGDCIVAVVLLHARELERDDVLYVCLSPVQGGELHAELVAGGNLGVELDPLLSVLAPVVVVQRAVRTAAVKVDVAAGRHW